FFQAEDGIRDPLVTGVQTCALPIWTRFSIPAGSSAITGDLAAAAYCGLGASNAPIHRAASSSIGSVPAAEAVPAAVSPARGGSRSEERRVGKEGRVRCAKAGEESKE